MVQSKRDLIPDPSAEEPPSVDSREGWGHARRYQFANCIIDIERHEVFSDGSAVEVEPQVFDLIILLASSPGRLASKDELVKEIWGGRAISDSTITNRINAARRAVGDDGFRQVIIASVPRRGIKFVAGVETVSSPRETWRAKPGCPTSDALNGVGLPARRPTALPVIGVLPFALQGAGPECVHLTGIADGISSELGRFHSLAVLRPSA